MAEVKKVVCPECDGEGGRAFGEGNFMYCNLCGGAGTVLESILTDPMIEAHLRIEGYGEPDLPDFTGVELPETDIPF